MSATPDSCPPLIRRPLRAAAGLCRRLTEGDEQIVVLGGGGWLGLAALELLSHALGRAFLERVRVFGSRARQLQLRDGTRTPCGVFAELPALERRPTLLLHFAFLTRDRLAGMSAADFVSANRGLSDAVARLIDSLPVRAIVMPSSGAVYGPGRSLEPDFAGNPYGALKLEDEHRFRQLAQGLGIRVVIPRVFNLSGPYINKIGAYVLASIIRDVLRSDAVVLRATRPVIRSYLHVGDLLEVCLHRVFDDALADGVPFDTAGVECVEVGELAQRVCRLLGRPQFPVRRAPLASSTPDVYLGDLASWRTVCAQYAFEPRGLDAQIEDTAADLQGRLSALGEMLG